MAKQTKVVTLSLPPDTIDRLDRLGDALGLSRSWIAARVLAGWLDSQGEPPPNEDAADDARAA